MEEDPHLQDPCQDYTTPVDENTEHNLLQQPLGADPEPHPTAPQHNEAENLRRTARPHKYTARYKEFRRSLGLTATINEFKNSHFSALFTESFEPQSYKEALKSDKVEKWMEAFEEEYNSLIENKTWKLGDIKTAFLYAKLDKIIYMKQPEGFVVKGRENDVRLLEKSLYGLRQAPLLFFKENDKVMHKFGLESCDGDRCIYIRRTGNELPIVITHVDDLLRVLDLLRVPERKFSSTSQRTWATTLRSALYHQLATLV